MASDGPRPEGSDGYDFQHRQKIALHYRDSVTFKSRLKSIFMMHGGLAFLIFIKLFDDIAHYQLGLHLGWLRKLNMPDAVFWEYWWFTSLAAIGLSLKALPKNRERELIYGYYVVFVCGCVPLAIGIGAELPELYRYLSDPATSDTFMFMGKFPMCVIWFMWFFVVLQVHATTMYFQWRLINIWRPLSNQEKIQLQKKDE